MATNGLIRHGKRNPWGVVLAVFLTSWFWAQRGEARSVGVGADPQAGANVPAAKKPTQKKARTKKSAPSKVATDEGAAAKRIVGKRDPFKLPPPPSPGRGPGEEILGPLPPGTRGLVISQLKLEGIVRLDTTNTMIAVVDTAANRAYFLRENDAVYNGVVSKITPDSVYFRENALDASGNVVTREVVKRLSPGPGEGR